MKKVILFIGLFLLALINSNTLTAQGCVEASSDEGPQIVGYIQPQFNYYMFGDKANGDPLKPSTFFFKRARVGVVGSIPYDVSYYVMAEFSPGLSGGSPYLLDAFVTYAPFGKYLKFSLGQFKSPFSLELNTPCYALHTINRSTVVNQLAAPFRDMGLMFLGSSDSLFGIVDLISYKIALTSADAIIISFTWSNTTGMLLDIIDFNIFNIACLSTVPKYLLIPWAVIFLLAATVAT